MDTDNFKFVGLLKDKKESKEKTYNGVVSFKLDSLFVEEFSRISGKLKDSYQILYSDISVDSVERKSFNKLCIEAPNHFLTLRVMDEPMLDEFEKVLKYKLTGKLEKGDVFVSTTVEEIKKYHELYVEGIITEDEFNAKKKQLLDL